MNIFKHILKVLILLLIIFSLLIAAFEFGTPNGVAKPFVIKNECLESMKKIQGACYFFLMERPKFTSEIEIGMLTGGGYFKQINSCGAVKASAEKNQPEYKIIYKRSGGEISYIDVVCAHHGSLSRQGDIDKEKGLPDGFVDNYIARVKTRFDMYK
jgi:hypothetical protein